MIRNIIFDLDNIIIRCGERDSLDYKKALLNCGYDENDYLEIWNAIDKYEKNKITDENPFYNSKDMIDYINDCINKEYDYKLFNELMNVSGENWTKKVILREDILERLYKKYNLYIFTNYYQEVQTKRIKKVGYSKYFKRIFGADIYGVKQYRSSFERVLNEINATPNECIMIGDEKDVDILGANNVGMKSILFDYDGKRDKKEIQLENYIVIDNLEKLLEIL